MRVTHIERAAGKPERATLDLDWPPSVNAYWRAIPAKRGGCRLIISADGRRYRNRAMAGIWPFGEPFAGRIGVEITLCPPTRRRLDVDNFAKCALDTLEHCRVFEDDNQIDRLVIERGPVERRGRVTVVVTARETQEATEQT